VLTPKVTRVNGIDIGMRDKKAPEVTRRRMYLETMERLFGGTDKIIMDSGATRGIVPYLPLDQFTHRPQTAPQTGGGR
jgi:membrane protease subunit HflK